MARHRLESLSTSSSHLTARQNVYIGVSAQVLAFAGVLTAFAPLLITPAFHIQKIAPTLTDTPSPSSNPQKLPHELYSRPEMAVSQLIGAVGSYTIACAYPDSIRVSGSDIIDNTPLTGFMSKQGVTVPLTTLSCQR
ncbi:hypothetical protein H7097_01475 [Aeromicrobium sp.]|nr:hypothetical protein [Candidatus Saccharibacteria bacterium]